MSALREANTFLFLTFENWIDAPWNKRKLCEECHRQIGHYWHEPTPFMKIWDGKKWLIRETAKSRCRNLIEVKT